MFNKKILSLLERLSSGNYFGKIELDFEKGKVVNIKKHDNIKPENLD